MRWDSDNMEQCPGHHMDNMDIVSDLVAALEGMLPTATGYGNSMDWEIYNSAVDNAKAVLRKAKGEP